MSIYAPSWAPGNKITSTKLAQMVADGVNKTDDIHPQFLGKVLHYGKPLRTKCVNIGADTNGSTASSFEIISGIFLPSGTGSRSFYERSLDLSWLTTPPAVVQEAIFRQPIGSPDYCGFDAGVLSWRVAAGETSCDVDASHITSQTNARSTFLVRVTKYNSLGTETFIDEQTCNSTAATAWEDITTLNINYAAKSIATGDLLTAYAIHRYSSTSVAAEWVASKGFRVTRNIP